MNLSKRKWSSMSTSNIQGVLKKSVQEEDASLGEWLFWQLDGICELRSRNDFVSSCESPDKFIEAEYLPKLVRLNFSVNNLLELKIFFPDVSRWRDDDLTDMLLEMADFKRKASKESVKPKPSTKEVSAPTMKRSPPTVIASELVKRPNTTVDSVLEGVSHKKEVEVFGLYIDRATDMLESGRIGQDDESSMDKLERLFEIFNRIRPFVMN